MATVHGKDATVSIDDSGGTARDISPYCNSVEISFEIDAPEDTAFGDAWRSKVVGLKDVSVSIEGHYDTTATVGSDTVLGAAMISTAWSSLTCSISPDNGTTTYAGEAILTSYTVSPPVDGIVTFSAELEGTGAWTRS